MAEFKQGVLTAQGAALLAKAQSGQANIRFTKFQLGCGEWDIETAALMQATELKDVRAEHEITRVSYVNDATTLLTLEASNTDNDSGYYITEVGVFVKDGTKEILYAIYVTQKDRTDWFPAYNSITPSSITYTCPISVANAKEISISVNGDSTGDGGTPTEIDWLNVVDGKICVTYKED